MADLFETTQQNISLHLQNLYEEGELRTEATHKEFLSVRREGNRNVQRRLDCYNLDVIISVGYRVKSKRGTQFRISATQRLRELLNPNHRSGKSKARFFAGHGYATERWQELA